MKISMATYQLQPPEYFNFSQPDEWPRWIRRFERFRQASGLVGKEEKQVNALIYAMGDEADDVMLSFGLSDAEKKKYGTVTVGSSNTSPEGGTRYLSGPSLIKEYRTRGKRWTVSLQHCIVWQNIVGLAR